MKKLLSLILSLTFILTVITPSFAAMQNPPSANVKYTYFEDGSYTISVIEDEPMNQSTKASNTTTKSKMSTHYSSSNVKLWYVKVTGTFTYDSKTSKCTSSQVSAGSYNNSWKISNKSASTSGSTAIASATAKLYTGTVISQTKQETVKLTCDKNGNFS